MKAGYAAALVGLWLLAGCGREATPPAPQKPRCGQVMSAPDKYSEEEVKRCEEKGYERTDRKGGY